MSPHIPDASAEALPLTDDRNPAPAPRQPRPPQLPALTAVRFFAALYVVFHHLVAPVTRWGPFAAMADAGYTGVSFFFLLSGFILTYTHAGEPSTGPAFRKRFLIARLARIYPVYLLTTVIAGYVMRDQFAAHVHILAFLSDLLLVQAWSIRMQNFFNFPAWSVSVEFVFYVLFPFLFLRLRPSTRTRAWLSFFGFWALAMAIPLSAILRHPGPVDMDSHLNFAITRVPVFAIPEFLAGILLGWVYLKFPLSRRTCAAMGTLGLLGLLVALFYADHLPALLLHNGLLIPLEALLILGITQPNWLTSLLSVKPLLLLGEASYSLYLLHAPVGIWIGEHFGLPQDLRTLPVKVSVAVALSIASFVWVERPSRRAILRWWNRMHPVG